MDLLFIVYSLIYSFNTQKSLFERNNVFNFFEIKGHLLTGKCIGLKKAAR